MKNTERFSNRVTNYVRYRPRYPKEIIPFLEDKIGLNSKWIIADVGSGTGISSELFLENDNKVYAVEPNLEMRNAAEELFKNNKNFISINGTAEATSLYNGSIDLIIVGQAFHWFDKKKSKVEFQRIAGRDAYLMLMWNDRYLESSFQQAYETLLEEFAVNYADVNYRNMDESIIRDFFDPEEFSRQTFKNTQFFNFEGLKGRLLSSSYAPLEHDKNYNPMLEKLKKIFEKYSVDSLVKFEYRCNIYYGKIKSE